MTMPDTTETRDVEFPLRLEGRADFHRPTIQDGGLGFYSAIDGQLDVDTAAFLREQKAEIERLSRELLEAKEALIPAHIYDPENWEYTMPLEDRASLVEDCDIVPGELKRFATLAPGPDMWAANVVLDRDEDGYPSECEIRWFNSEAEARSVLAPKKDSDNDA